MPYAVSALADLPDSLQPAARQSVGAADRLISICVFPGRTHLKDMAHWENIPEQALLFTDRGILHIQAPATSDDAAKLPVSRSLYAADLLYARLSLILMYGRLELVDKSLSRVGVDFNAAGFDIIQAGLQHLLRTACGKDTLSIPDVPHTKTLLDELGELSYKFKNGLYLYGLLPGEHVLGFVFQPGLWGQRWHLFPLKKSETTLLALTDKQLIVVEERSRSRFPAYGWIFTFYPRHVIDRIDLTSGQRWQELKIRLKNSSGHSDRSILLEVPNGLVWQELWSQYGNPRLTQI